MSCHDIGRGVDFIISKVLDMYDDGKISKEATLEMLSEFPSAVNYCDGNEYEALETLTKTHCAKCLKKYGGNGERVSFNDAYDILQKDDFIEPGKYSYSWWHDATEARGITGRSLCRDCFKEVFDGVITEAGIKKILSAEKEAE